jgi:hypothetical protein
VEFLLGSDCVVSKKNTGGKYDSLAFKKSVGFERVRQRQ